MHVALRTAFENEMMAARRARHDADAAREFQHLQRAHVLGQHHVWPHTRSHLAMFALAWRQRDVRALAGQLLRIIGGAIGSIIGRVPLGNTGGSNISPLQVLPIADDLLTLLKQDPRSAHALHKAGYS